VPATAGFYRSARDDRGLLDWFLSGDGPFSMMKHFSRHPVCLLVLLVAVAGAGACSPKTSAPLPAGITFAGDAHRLIPLLRRLEQLTDTRLARQAGRLETRLDGCRRFIAYCPAGAPCDLAAAVRCDGSPPASEADALAGDADWLLARVASDQSWLLVRGRLAADGSVALDAELSDPDETSALGLLLPAADPAGPARLATADALLHVRLRPDGGLDLARFIQGGGWGARLYRLQSDLFEGTTLAGVWELAVYTPDTGNVIPPMALAVDIRDRRQAVSVMEKFLKDLQSSWPLRRSPFELGGWDGACLTNLNVMPDLAPCYVATDAALVIGWNPASLERALAAPATGGAEAGAGDAQARQEQAPGVRLAAGPGAEASRLSVFFDRLPRADAILARSSGSRVSLGPRYYPWRRLVVEGRRGKGRFHFTAELESR